MNLEGAQCVFVVGRDEDDRRLAVRAERPCELEAIQLGHLDVKKQQVGGDLLDGRNRLGAVRALADDFDIRLLAQEGEDMRARHRLVVHHQRANLRHETHA